jgi:hypothetical protein
VWKAATKDYGLQVPSGWLLRGWMLWIIGTVVTLVGIGALASGSVVLGCVLIGFAAALVAHTFTDLTY